MRKIRILVIDDDIISRTLLRNLLCREDDLEIAGVAMNGKTGLKRIPELKPDLVTLDIEMPGMNGLEVLDRIREQWPELPVIMVSGHTDKGAEEAMEALSRGASDYVTKPQGRSARNLPIDQLRAELLPKIRAISGGRRTSIASKPQSAASAETPGAPAKPSTAGKPIEILAIGLSTGGPAALAKVIPALDPRLPVPVVLVQHMPPTFTRLLAERLNMSTELTVCEAQGGEALQPGSVYIAPGNHHMTVHSRGSQVAVRVNQNPPENCCRPSVDPLFRSVAKVFGPRALALVLTGMGQDGLLGAEAIKEAGGQVLVQDKDSSVVWGMPGAIATRGLADAELPLEAIAPELNRRICGERPDSTARAKAG